MTEIDNLIQVKNLNKSFGELKVLKNVNLSVKKGDKIAIIGPSGSGKSTLLRCLNFLEKAESGEIIFNGENIIKKGVNINTIRQKMGMVFQHFNLFPHLTVLENITLAPIKLKLKSKVAARELAIKLLTKINLLDKADEYPSRLSGGQKQRVAIARALAMEPAVMLFDEPTSALDPEMIGEVLSLIKELALEGMTMLIVTHEMGFAREVSTDIVFMDEGNIVAKLPPKEFFNNTENERIKSFLSKMLSGNNN